ncbi:MAG: TonB-dependent copper receptor, partial [Magnetospirillum sp.]|nr:TonB-dependent copper receptor [Magnetospirillum sp.]
MTITQSLTGRCLDARPIFAATFWLALLSPVVAVADEQPATLDEVVVTAPMLSQPLVVETDPRNPRQPVPPADGAGYLKSIPGFAITRKGGIDGDPLLRGQGGSRLNVLIDGTPLLGGCGNRMDPPTAYIFPDSFDKLTVLKGPQSVVHGGAALGTVLVERQTKRFKELSVRGNASALYGSFDRNDEVLDMAGGDTPGYVRMIGTHSSSDDYRDGNGNAVHSNYWRRSGTALVGWTPDDRTTIEASLDKSEAQAAYADRGMDGSKFDREGMSLKVTRTEISPLLAKVQATLYRNYVDHIMDGYSLRQNNGMGASNPDHLMMGGKAQAELTPGSATKLILGGEYNQDQHSARSLSNAEYLSGVGLDSKQRVVDMTFDTAAGFGEINHELSGDTRLIGGYRLTHVSAAKHNIQPNLSDDRTLNSGFGRIEHDIRLGVPLTAYAGLGHVERAPDFWERNKSIASFSTGTEKTDQLDVGALFTSGPWHGSVSAFYARTEDYILVSSTRSKNVDAHTRGGEAELSYKVLPQWTIEATAAYVHGENDSDNVPLAQTPPLDTSLAVKYDDGTFLGGL